MTEASAQSNLALMRAALDAMALSDLDACVAMLTPDFRINIAGMPAQRQGAKAWREHATTMWRAFPDLVISIEDMFAIEDKVAVRLRFTGTQDGPFLGQAATGRRIDYQSNELYRIEGGKIAEEWICSDTLTMMTQIGVLAPGQLIGLWLAGYRLWFGLALGVLVGAGGAGLVASLI